MGRRYTNTKNYKAAKYKDNYGEATAATDLTSQDMFYTTESNQTQSAFESYPNKPKNYMDYYTNDPYDSRLFETNSRRRKKRDNYMSDDYITSAASFDDPRKRPRDFFSPKSKSVSRKKTPERLNFSSSFSDYPSLYGKDRRRSRLTQNHEKRLYESLLEDSEHYAHRERKHKSPEDEYFEDLIHEKPEKEFDYRKYFQQTQPKERVSSKYKNREDKHLRPKRGQDYQVYAYKEPMNHEGVFREDKYRQEPHSKPRKDQDFQVYAYKEPTHHEGVFKGKTSGEEATPSSEVEIKGGDTQYPLLAFKDEHSSKNGSDMVYLPVIVLDKKSGKSGTTKSPKELTHQTNKEHFQVYAANLENQHNIFQNFGDFPKFDTPDDTKDDGKGLATKPHHGAEASSGMRYAGSLLGSIIDEALINPEIKERETVNNGYQDENQRFPFVHNHSSLAYQVDVDIAPKDKKESLRSKGKSGEMSRSNDPLHNSYPVSKDYIKVRVSDQVNKSKEGSQVLERMSTKDKTSEMKGANENPTSTQVINEDKISMSIAQSKVSPAKKSIMRSASQVLIDEPLTEQSPSLMRHSTAKGSKQGSTAAPRAEKSIKKNASQILIKDQPQTDISTKGSTAAPRGSTKETEKKRTTAKTKLSPVREEIAEDLTEKSSGTKLSKKASKTNINETLTIIDNRKSTKPQIQSGSFMGNQNKEPTIVAKVTSIPDDRKSVFEQVLAEDRRGKAPTIKKGEYSQATKSPRMSLAQNRKSVVSHKTTEKSFAMDQSQKPSTRPFSYHSSHLSTPVGKVEEENESINALRQFTRDVFQVDIDKELPQLKTSAGRSELNKSDENKGPTASKAERTDKNKQPTVGLQYSVASKKPIGTINLTENVDQAHVGTETGLRHEKTTEDKDKKSHSSFKTTGRLLTAIKSLGKQKSREENLYLPTNGSLKSQDKAKSTKLAEKQEEDKAPFVRSIEPTVTQYKKEQKKTPTLVKQGSRSETKIPKEKRSLSRLFSRSKSNEKMDGDSGGDGKRQKTKSRSLLGILRKSRSKSSVMPHETDQSQVEESNTQSQECDCLAQYVSNARTCAYFFLGATLHEQIMNIIKMMVNEI